MRQRENGSKQRHAVREGKARSDSAIFPSKAARKPAETNKALKADSSIEDRQTSRGSRKQAREGKNEEPGAVQGRQDSMAWLHVCMHLLAC